MQTEIKKDEDIVKGQCISCPYLQTRDDGYQRSLIYTKTKRGKTITWTMHTGKLTGGMSVGAHTYIGGSFIPDTIEELDVFLIDAIKNRIPPKWCIYRKDEKI